MSISSKSNFVTGGAIPGSGNWQGSDADGMLQESNNLIEESGQTLNSGNKNQTSIASSIFSARGNIYIGGGVADVYTAAPIGTQKAFSSYEDGMEIRVVIGGGVTNTGASTIDVATLGIKNILFNSVPLLAGMIPQNSIIRLRYDGTQFNLVQDIDDDAFYIDKINKRIGVGKTNPSEAVDVVGGAIFTGNVNSLNSVKAFCVFDGSAPSASIISQYNISMLTRNGVGDYTLTFNSALATSDYAVSFSSNERNISVGGPAANNYIFDAGVFVSAVTPPSTTDLTINVLGWNAGAVANNPADNVFVTVTVF